MPSKFLDRLNRSAKRRAKQGLFLEALGAVFAIACCLIVYIYLTPSIYSIGTQVNAAFGSAVTITLGGYNGGGVTDTTIEAYTLESFGVGIVIMVIGYLIYMFVSPFFREPGSYSQ